MSSHNFAQPYIRLSPRKRQSEFIINISKQLAFGTKKIGWVITLTSSPSKMFDVGDLPVMTFGNCVLQTGVIKWPLSSETVHTLLNVFFVF